MASTGRRMSSLMARNWGALKADSCAAGSISPAACMPDRNYGDNQLAISDSFFYADFWYRNEFVMPPVARGKHAWLNFDGVNWKADVFLNGEKLGRIEGGFMRGRFDITSRVHAGQRNALAVLVEKNERK